MPSLSFGDLGRVDTLPLALKNMYVEPTPQGPAKTRRMPRPGLLLVNELGVGPVRCSFQFLDVRITVSGAKVFSDDVQIGTIPASGPVRFAVSNEECVIISNNRAYYVDIVAPSVTLIVDPDLPQVKDVIFIAGRFVYFDADNSGIYRWSEVNDAQNIAGLAFASAESSPDPITGALVIGDNIFIAGSLTGEWHYPQEDITAPFQRSKGRRYDKGTTAIRSLALADNAGYFVGNDRIIYRTSQVPVRVSDDDMEDRLRRLTDAQLAEVSAYPIVYSGHTFYVVNLPGLGTWALDIGLRYWAEWSSWERGRFRADSCDANGVMGDLYSGKTFKFDGETYTDFEDAIDRRCAAFLPLQGGVQRNTNVVLHCSKGVGLPTGFGSDPKVEMRFSDHEGADFSNWREAELGAMGDRSKAAMAHWVGLGTILAPGRLFEFRCTQPVFWSPYMLTYNEVRP